MEIRTTAGAVALRPSATKPGATMITGMIPFNSRSGALRAGAATFVETIAPSAFVRSLRTGADVLGLREHDPAQLLGRSKAGTLRLSVGTRGLNYEIDAPIGVSYSDDLLVLLQRGDLVASSFGFRVADGGDRWGYTDSGQPLRTLVDVDLFDVSVVSNAAYPSSTAGIVHSDAQMPMAPAMAGRSSSAPAGLARALAEHGERARRDYRSEIERDQRAARRRELHMLRPH